MIWSTNSTYSKYFFSRYYTLLFDISSRNLCIDSNFFIKKRYFFIIFVTFGLRGVPLGKRFEKGYQNGRRGTNPKMGFFVHREAFGPLSKNMKF